MQANESTLLQMQLEFKRKELVGTQKPNLQLKNYGSLLLLQRGCCGESILNAERRNESSYLAGKTFEIA